MQIINQYKLTQHKQNKMFNDNDNDNEQIQEPEFQQYTNELRPQTEDIKGIKYQSFNQMKLKEHILKSLAQKEYFKPTPVQQQAIPIVMSRKNMIVKAKNGTGKTGAYLIPILNEIDENNKYIKGVVLLPNHEVAKQTLSHANEITKFSKIKAQLFIGCENKEAQDLAKIDKGGLHLMVCTPGRLRVLLSKRKGMLNHCEFFVLDEGDKLIQGDYFLPQILCHLKTKCNLMLFTATIPYHVRPFKQKFMPDAEVLNLIKNDDITLKGITEYYYLLTEEKQKALAIFHIYKIVNINQCIIFCAVNHRTQKLSKLLNQKGFSTKFFNSSMTRNQRNKVFNQFRKGQLRTLISSDLLSRGLDIPAVNVVINFDFPERTETYLHRIGRSGRNGQIGLAINIITEKDSDNLLETERRLHTKITKMPKQIDQSLYVN